LEVTNIPEHHILPIDGLVQSEVHFSLLVEGPLFVFLRSILTYVDIDRTESIRANDTFWLIELWGSNRDTRVRIDVLDKPTRVVSRRTVLERGFVGYDSDPVPTIQKVNTVAFSAIQLEVESPMGMVPVFEVAR